ncbi:MAG: VOC family protein [Pseudomonadales bacterium]
MIDHVSIGVANIEKATTFYEAVLAHLGLQKLIANARTVGFGKNYPEFWLNHRPQRNRIEDDNGDHICLRAKTAAAVDAFFAAGLELGATSDGEPGPRPQYSSSYYSAFIRDIDGNKIEVVTFIEA